MKSKTEKGTINRRAFLTGAAGLVGASALGMPSAAVAAAAQTVSRGAAAPTLLYWDGVEFMSPSNLRTNDPSLDSVQITLSGHGTGSIRSIDLRPKLATGEQAVFYAWTAPPNGVALTQCVMPVDKMSGLQLGIGLGPKSLPLSLGATGAGPKLRVGTYVLALGDLSAGQYVFDPTSEVGPVVSSVDGQPAPFQYVVIGIARP